MPLLYWLIIRKRNGAQTGLVAVTAASYFAFVVLLAVQALRGQSIIDPDSLTLAAWAVWLLLTAAAWLAVNFSSRTKLLKGALGAI